MYNRIWQQIKICILCVVFSFSFLATPLLAKQQSNHSHLGKSVFIFDPRGLTWTVYKNGKYIRSGRAVGGKHHCADVHRPCKTPVGTFRIYAKEGPHFRSSIYPLPNGGASMPWAMFFRGGYAIHGSNEVPNRPASHGCIRVYPSAAKWLHQVLPIGTVVVVKPY